MSTLNTTIETAYGKASTCTQPESQRWLELAMMAASRGWGEGIAIFLRCVLTLGLPEELAQARDTCVLRLIKRHGRYFIKRRRLKTPKSFSLGDEKRRW